MIKEKSRAIIRLRPLLIKKQEQTSIIGEREGRVWDSLREKEMKVEECIRVFGEEWTTQGVFEELKIEQTVWKSIEQG